MSSQIKGNCGAIRCIGCMGKPLQRYIFYMLRCSLKCAPVGTAIRWVFQQPMMIELFFNFSHTLPQLMISLNKPRVRKRCSICFFITAVGILQVNLWWCQYSFYAFHGTAVTTVCHVSIVGKIMTESETCDKDADRKYCITFWSSNLLRFNKAPANLSLKIAYSFEDWCTGMKLGYQWK